MVERRIETSIEIDAPPKRVWALLTNFALMPTWNPFIKSISGNLAKGARLSVHIVPPGKSGMHFHPTVLSVRPERLRRLFRSARRRRASDPSRHFEEAEAAPVGRAAKSSHDRIAA
jgi:uncharacterized protein YndB with AHSA1/START domain